MLREVSATQRIVPLLMSHDVIHGSLLPAGKKRYYALLFVYDTALVSR